MQPYDTLSPPHTPPSHPHLSPMRRTTISFIEFIAARLALVSAHGADLKGQCKNFASSAVYSHSTAQHVVHPRAHPQHCHTRNVTRERPANRAPLPTGPDSLTVLYSALSKVTFVRVHASRLCDSPSPLRSRSRAARPPARPLRFSPARTSAPPLSQRASLRACASSSWRCRPVADPRQAAASQLPCP